MIYIGPIIHHLSQDVNCYWIACYAFFSLLRWFWRITYWVAQDHDHWFFQFPHRQRKYRHIRIIAEFQTRFFWNHVSLRKCFQWRIRRPCTSSASLRFGQAWSKYAVIWLSHIFLSPTNIYAKSTPTEESMDPRTRKGWEYHEQTKACHNYKYIKYKYISEMNKIFEASEWARGRDWL